MMTHHNRRESTRRGRLNILQRTMLQWNELHPYNAVNVVEIAGAFELERLRNAVDGTLESHGLTNLTLSADGRGYHYHGGPSSAAIEIVASGESPRHSLCAEIERQLNTGFVLAGRFSPFRFFVVPEENAFCLGLVYFHAIADDAAVVLLMKDIVGAYTASNRAPAISPIELCPSRHDNLLRRHPQVLARKLASLPSLVREMRSSCRPHGRDKENLHNGLTFFPLEPATLPGLIEAGKALDVTVNDLFLAAILKSVSPLAAGRTRAPRRKKLSVACIVNLRRDLGMEARRTFGVSLGLFVVTHEVPEGISLSDLARDIRGQTLAIKRHRLYLGTPLEMGYVRLILPLFSNRQRKKLYWTHYPLWGGITNMNLNSVWEPADKEMPLDYIRAVSTGPATPLVLSITTFRNTLNISASYRSTFFSGVKIERIKTGFIDALGQLGNRP